MKKYNPVQAIQHYVVSAFLFIAFAGSIFSGLPISSEILSPAGIRLNNSQR